MQYCIKLKGMLFINGSDRISVAALLHYRCAVINRPLRSGCCGTSAPCAGIPPALLAEPTTLPQAEAFCETVTVVDASELLMYGRVCCKAMLLKCNNVELWCGWRRQRWPFSPLVLSTACKTANRRFAVVMIEAICVMAAWPHNVCKVDVFGDGM